jgi:nucleotide-binding universal stress UspA family protein
MTDIFRRILVAVSGTPTAEAAAKLAIRLAAAHGAALRLVHVVDADLAVEIARVTQRPKDELLAQMTTTGQHALRHVERMAQQDGQMAETKLRSGVPAAELLAEANDWPADLIVLGSTSRHGPRRLAIGRVIDPVLENADCPVLVVRHALTTA